MFDFVRGYRTPLMVVVTILLPLLFYRANVRRPAQFSTLDRIVLYASTPLNKFMASLTGGISDAWYRYVDLSQAREDGIELRRQLDVLMRERDQLEFLGQENERLRALLAINDGNPDAELVNATVIGAGSDLTARTLTLDIGAMHNVPRGAPVLAGQGLVGVVHRVAWTSCEVITIADPRLNVLAHVVRTRARGRIRGHGPPPGHALEFYDVLSETIGDVRIGDRVATSGLGRVLPKDVPVGVVRDVEGTIDIEPYVDFARLEHVTVLVQRPVPQIMVTPEPLLPRTLRTSTTATVARTSTTPGTP